MVDYNSRVVSQHGGAEPYDLPTVLTDAIQRVGKTKAQNVHLPSIHAGEHAAFLEVVTRVNVGDFDLGTVQSVRG